MKLLDNTLYAEEVALEQDSIQRGVERYRKLAALAVNRGDGAALQPTERLLAAWFPALEALIAREQSDFKDFKPAIGRQTYGKWLVRLAPDKCAAITMHTVFGQCLMERAGVTTARLVMAVSGATMAEWNHGRLLKMKGDALHDLMHSNRCRLNSKRINAIAAKHVACGDCARSGTCPFALDAAHWPLTVRGHVGTILLNLLMVAAKIPGDNGEVFPALEHYIIRTARRRTGMVRLTDAAREIIDAGHMARQFLRPKYQPMLVPPAIWTATDRGGYIELPVSLIKRTRSKAIPHDVYRAVNALNATSWRINKRILDVVEQLWATGGNIADIPPKAPRLKPPLPPGTIERDGYSPNGKPIKVTDWPSPEAKKAWKQAAADTYRRNAQEESERINFERTLEIAQRMAEYRNLYFPHQLDFRGRIYSVPLFLNHQSNDVCRGLLEFANPIAPGPMGDYWLKVHLANSCGIDKVSFANRITWVEQNADRFARWRTDPLTHTDWTEVDKPFQALAAAYALDDPEAARHLPVQLDGSNNAMQHYAAMLRDSETAALVNLIPTDTPQDFYADVTHYAQTIVAQDAEAGKPIARELEGWIDRALVKQTTMTVFYGVTEIGARRQIRTRLNEAGFVAERQYHASKYLAGLVLKSVAASCPAAHAAFRWLSSCANLIAASGNSVIWTTPFGMDAKQPYLRTTPRIIRTCLQHITLRSCAGDLPVLKRKQTQAFPPNFVHSIDAAHLINTAIRMAEEGIPFAGVHDSYWSHAGNVPAMSAIIRQEFAALHKTPLLTALHGQFVARYPDIAFPTPPVPGALDIEKVMQSDYAFC